MFSTKGSENHKREDEDEQAGLAIEGATWSCISCPHFLAQSFSGNFVSTLSQCLQLLWEALGYQVNRIYRIRTSRFIAAFIRLYFCNLFMREWKYFVLCSPLFVRQNPNIDLLSIFLLIL